MAGCAIYCYNVCLINLLDRYDEGGNIGKDSPDQIEDRYSVPNGGQHLIAIRSEDDIPLTINGTTEVLEPAFVPHQLSSACVSPPDPPETGNLPSFC
jgi:hypothetical protein